MRDRDVSDTAGTESVDLDMPREVADVLTADVIATDTRPPVFRFSQVAEPI